jgi:hypothetical protein
VEPASVAKHIILGLRSVWLFTRKNLLTPGRLLDPGPLPSPLINRVAFGLDLTLSALLGRFYRRRHARLHQVSVFPSRRRVETPGIRGPNGLPIVEMTEWFELLKTESRWTATLRSAKCATRK